MKLYILGLMIISAAPLTAFAAEGDPTEPVHIICTPTTRSVVKFYSFEGGDTYVWLRDYSKAVIKQRDFSTKVAFQSGRTDIELAIDTKLKTLKGHVTDERGTEQVNVIIKCQKTKGE